MVTSGSRFSPGPKRNVGETLLSQGGERVSHCILKDGAPTAHRLVLIRMGKYVCHSNHVWKAQSQGEEI